MPTTTLGVKLDELTRERLKAAARHIDRTPHWLIKQAIYSYLERLESGALPAAARAASRRSRTSGACCSAVRARRSRSRRVSMRALVSSMGTVHHGCTSSR